MTDDMKTELFEHRFWIRIMLEHLYIIMNALNYRETEEHAAAVSLIRNFNVLLARCWEETTEEQLRKLREDAYNATQEIYRYKLHLLNRQLTSSIAMGLPSGLTSRLINEAEYYLGILTQFMQNKKFVNNATTLHILWLVDAAGHAEIIGNGLNYSNTDLKEKTQIYQREFISLYVRALELKGFQRIGQNDFPAYDQFNEDVNSRLTDFTEFFVDLNNKIITGKVLITVAPVTLDHMYREECYYLTELSKVSKIRAPVCDPTVQGFELPK